MNSTLKIEKKYADSITNLALDTLKNNKQALIFVNTKRSAEKCAEEISKKLKDSPKWLIELSNLSLKAVSKPTKQCKRLSTCLEKGIAFHHASLHSKQKELIESNFRKGNIKIICCTPTLAAGLDLPAFRAIIRDVKRYTGRGMQNIPVLEYLQMAGRCVSEDTVVFTEKGYPIKVSEIVRKYFKEKEIGTKKIKNFKILSVNLKTNKPTLSEVKIVWKRKIKKMLEIETKSGKIIKVSEDHPLLTFTKINCGKARISKTLEDKEGLYNEVMKLREKYGWGENKISRYLGIFEKRNLIKHWFSGKTKPQKKVFSWKKANQVKRFNCYAKTDYLASLVNFDDFNEIIAPRKYLPKEKIIQIDKNTFLTKQGHTKCDFPEKWSEDLCRFIAKIMSDGSIYYNKKDNSYQIRYFNKNRSIQNEYVNMCLNLFNKKAQVKWRRGSYEARFKAYLIGKFLENIGVPAGKKSFILKMPNPIFALPKKMIKSFFLEYVRCDGWEKPESYTIITSSKKLAYDFALLLSKIGYLARIQKKKPNNWRKKEIWETSVSKSQFNETKKKNCVGNIFPDLIKSIKVINKEQYVYDFTLDKEHNFVANGLIIHNSGRPNWDSEGQAILIASSDSEKDALTEKYVCGEPEDIFSKLAVEPVLRTYLLSLIATKVIQTKQQILDFFEKTFWAFQFKDMNKLKRTISKMLSLLESWEFIQFLDNKFRATVLGKRIAELYIDPLTAHDFVIALEKAQSKIRHISLLQLVCNTLEMRPLLRVKMKEYDDFQEHLSKYEVYFLTNEPSMFEAEFDDYLNSVKTAFMLNDWIEEKDDDFLMNNYDIGPGITRVKIETANWLLYSLYEIARILQRQDVLKDIVKLKFRLKYGAKEELLPLLKIKNIGRIRARKLFRSGFKQLADLRKAKPEFLTQILGSKKVAEDILREIGVEIEKNNNKGQLSNFS